MVADCMCSPFIRPLTTCYSALNCEFKPHPLAFGQSVWRALKWRFLSVHARWATHRSRCTNYTSSTISSTIPTCFFALVEQLLRMQLSTFSTLFDSSSVHPIHWKMFPGLQQAPWMGDSKEEVSISTLLLTISCFVHISSTYIKYTVLFFFFNKIGLFDKLKIS